MRDVFDSFERIVLTHPLVRKCGILSGQFQRSGERI
jgi:hypothetical protein